MAPDGSEHRAPAVEVPRVAGWSRSVSSIARRDEPCGPSGPRRLPCRARV